MTASSSQTYTYLHPSSVREQAAGHTLALATSGGATPAGPAAHPRLFQGFLTSPTAAATALLAIAEVASARYHWPRLSSLLDPVITADGDRLRFESFSGCGGVYARFDVSAPALDGDEVGLGTTNVDLNIPLRRALTRLEDVNTLHLQVGPESMVVSTFDGTFVEKKVPLPQRWVRGFAESQVLAAGFELRAEVSAAEAAAVLRSMPTSSRAHSTHWMALSGRTLRPVSNRAPGAICLPGPERLSGLRRVLRHASTVRLYAPTAPGKDSTAVAWEVALPGMRMTLMLSQDVARGFSGEGGVLSDLAIGTSAADAELVSVLLAWDSKIDVANLARQTDLSSERVRAALTMLGALGQIGYDLGEEAYFHRRLPYAADQVEVDNPRLKAARAIVANGLVRFDGVLAWVGKIDHLHVVRLGEAGKLSCTCPWWANYRGGRGPCKHALAVRIIRDSMAVDT